MYTNKPDINEINRIYEYKDGVLIFKITVGKNGKTPKGSVAGTKNLNDRVYIKMNGSGVRYTRSRVIWYMITGIWPDTIDHINGIPSDDRFENLRNVSSKENARNAKLRKDSSTKVTGVHYFKNTNKWHAQIAQDGKSSNLGYYDKFEDAVNARQAAEKENGYHPNHGQVR